MMIGRFTDIFTGRFADRCTGRFAGSCGARRRGAGVAASLLALAALGPIGESAVAHTDEYFDSVASPHGGQVRMTGPYHFELVAKPDALTVYVTDHADNKMSSAGAKGVATISTDGKIQNVRLMPAGDNTMSAPGPFAIGADTVITVSIGLADEPMSSATFKPTKKAAAPSAHQHHHGSK